MFITEGTLVRAVYDDDTVYTGTVYKIVIQTCKEDNNIPHAAVFISQDKRFIEQDGEFGCADIWVERIKSIEIL